MLISPPEEEKEQEGKVRDTIAMGVEEIAVGLGPADAPPPMKPITFAASPAPVPASAAAATSTVSLKSPSREEGELSSSSDREDAGLASSSTASHVGNLRETVSISLKTSPARSSKAERFYSRDRENYNLFGNRIPGDEEFRKAWAKEMDEDDCLWTASEDDDKDSGADSKRKHRPLEKEIKKIRMRAKEKADLIDGDESDELRSLCSESDDEVTLWSGSECDDDDDIPTEAHPSERSDPYIDKLFEFEETPKYKTIAELLRAEKEPPELSPGKQARKLAVENALKKLKKGPDGRYINVWEVISDIDILIGAFENIVSGPEYAELREGGPKKLNMQFFKDIQARMRDPNFKFSPELKLKPKSKLVPKKKWQKAQSRRRKNERR